MELLLFVAGWYGLGLVGGAIALAWWWWHGLAITVDEIRFNALWAVLGPIVLMGAIALLLLEVPKAAYRRLALTRAPHRLRRRARPHRGPPQVSSTHTEEHLAECVAAYLANGRNKQAAADATGMTRHAMRRRLFAAAEQGMLGTEPVLPGYRISQVSTGPNGTFVQQRPERGPQYQPIEGMALKGRTTWTDADGRVTQQVHMERADRTPIDWAAQLQEAFKDYEPKGYPLPAPDLAPIPSGRRLTLTPLADLHVGLKAWAGETGTNWDLNIAERVISEAIDDLVGRTPPSKRAIVLGGGDLLHSDNNENKTARSGNVLDVDGRYDKCLDVAERLVVRTIDAHLLRHESVTVRILKGNHDEHAAVAVSHFLKGHYRNEPRVTVDTDASLFFWYRFGRVMLGATHGHEAKIRDMPAIMAHRRAEDWGATKFRYIHGFHLHHSAKFATEGGGCISEVHQTPTPQDAWHYGSGFLSGRSLQSITYDAFLGEVGRTRVAIVDGEVPEAANDNEPQMRRAG